MPLSPEAASVYNEAIQVARNHTIEQQRILRLVGNEASALASVSAQSLAQLAAMQTTSEMAQLLGAYAEALGDNIDREHQQQLRRLYTDIAKEGQSAVVKRYKRMIRSEGLKYRGADSGKFKRYTGGRMLRALESDGNLFKVSNDGLEFVMPRLLDAEAPQWYRLNFGAKPASQRPSPEFKIQFFDLKIPGASFSRLPASRSFYVPAGVWSATGAASTAAFARSAGGKKQGANPSFGRALYPLSQWPEGMSAPTSFFDGQMSKGIVGYRFLEEGLRVMNRDLGAGLEQMLRQWTAEAADASRPNRSPLRIDQKSAEKGLRDLNEFYQKTNRLRAGTQKRFDALAREPGLKFNYPNLPPR